MAADSPSGKLAVILHADVAGSTRLVQIDEQIAHQRIQEIFHRLGEMVSAYHGRVLELRGDALLAEFERASDAVSAALAFQAESSEYNNSLEDEIKPIVRIGISMGEVIIADGTMTGEGVVLAQRLEQLADPGTIVIQGAAYETVPGRYPFDFVNLGELEVKGFEETVRAFKVTLRQGDDLPPSELPVRKAGRNRIFGIAVVLLLTLITIMLLRSWQVENGPLIGGKESAVQSAKASLIVLPFNNLSDDSNQAYLAQGITEDITTDLSRIRGLFVVSRNTAFTYQNKVIDPKQISNELGVTYLLEGSIRRVDDLLRINVQLIDGKSGGHLWANRYDGSTDDVLVFQDNVIENIVSALSLKLDIERGKQIAATETTNPKAYDAFLRGWAHFRLRTPENYAEATRHFKRAIELDPDYSRAHAALASTYWEGWERWWHEPLGFEEWIGPRQEAERYLEIALKNPTALAHQVASEVRRQESRHKDMVREAETAVQLDPNDPNSYVALTWALALTGKPEEALTAVDRALALDPHHPAFYLYLKGFVKFMLKEYEVAADLLERALELNPDNFSAKNILIPTYAYLGKLDASKEQLASHPLPLSIDWVGYYWRYKEPRDWEHLAKGLRLAGVPDVATELPKPPKD